LPEPLEGLRNYDLRSVRSSSYSVRGIPANRITCQVVAREPHSVAEEGKRGTLFNNVLQKTTALARSSLAKRFCTAQ